VSGEIYETSFNVTAIGSVEKSEPYNICVQRTERDLWEVLWRRKVLNIKSIRIA
jgi:hypothetical protein